MLFTLTLYAGGCVLAPDADGDKTTITRSGGVITRAIAEALQALSRFVFRATARRCDRGTGEHRYLIHSIPFAIAAGIAVAATTAVVPQFGPYVTPGYVNLGDYGTIDIPDTITLPGAGAVFMIVMLSASIRSLFMELHEGQKVRVKKRGDWSRRISKGMYRGRQRHGAFLYAVLVTLALWAWGGTDAFPPLAMGIVTTVGMLTHNSGDSATNSGIPWKFPIPHRCDKHRAAYLQAACSRLLVRLPWHHCNRCDQARKRYPRCAMWDRNTFVPKRWAHSVGTDAGRARERKVAAWSIMAACAMLSAGVVQFAAATLHG